jgi:hypothetical protein
MIFRLFLLVLICQQSFAQTGSSNFLLLKKGEKTIQKYFAGNGIRFFTTEGMPVEGIIEKITADSIYLINQNVRRIQRADGAVIFDTTGKYSLLFSLSNIGSFPVGKQRGKNILTEGTLLMIAGGGYLVLNIFNTTREGDPPFGEENLSNVLIASGLMATGFLLKKAWPKKYYIGKKYHLKVIES